MRDTDNIRSPRKPPSGCFASRGPGWKRALNSWLGQTLARHTGEFLFATATFKALAGLILWICGACRG